MDMATRDFIAKIGMTARDKEFESIEKAAMARIQEQHNSENQTNLELLRSSPEDNLLTWNVEDKKQPCPWTDEDWTRKNVLELETRIHDMLERNYERIINTSNKKSELFRLIPYEDMEDVVAGSKKFSEIVKPIVEPVINKVLGEIPAVTFTPRPHQRWVTGRVLDEWNKSTEKKVIIPLFLAPRFGKTLNVLEIWKKLQHKIGIVEAHMLSALTSFSNAIMDGFDITYDVEYLRIVPGNIDEQIDIANTRIAAGKRILFLVSMHYSKTERDKIKNDMAEEIQLFWDENALGESESGDTGGKWQELLQCFLTDNGEFEEKYDSIISIVDEDEELEPENKDGLLDRLSKLKETFEMINEDTESQDDYVDLSHLHKISELIETHEGATIYVDEADYGAHTDRSRKVTEAILKNTEQKSCILLGTGTHIERATAPFGNKLACFPITVTYSDMLIAKKSEGFLFEQTYLNNLNQEQEHEKKAITYIHTHKPDAEKSMKGYVEPRALFLKLSNEVSTILDFGDKTPSWARLHGGTKNSDALREMFKHLLKDGMGSDMNLRNHFNKINEKEERELLGPFMTLMFFGGNSKASIGRLVDAATAAVNDYECIELTSKTTSNEAAELFVKSQIRQAKQKGKAGALIFSMGMGQRSFSIGEIDAVVEIYDGGDSNVARQKQSRALTPTKTGKQVGFIVCLSFNQERYEHMLPMILKDASAMLDRKEVDSLDEGIKTVYRTQLWYHLDVDNEPKCRFESGESLIEEVLNNQIVISKVLGSMCTPDAIMCDDELLEIALTLAKSVSKVSTKHNESAERILKAVKTHKRRLTGENENGEEDAEDLSALTMTILKERCKDAGLPVSGKKDELIERLKEFHQKENDATAEKDYDGVAKNIVRQAIERICRLPHLFAVNFPGEEKFLSVLKTIEANQEYSQDLESLLGIDIDSTQKLVEAMFKEESTQIFLDMAFTNSRNIVQNQEEAA